MRIIRAISTSYLWFALLCSACGSSNDGHPNDVGSGGASQVGAGGSLPNAGGTISASSVIGSTAATGGTSGASVSWGGLSATGGGTYGVASNSSATGGATNSTATGGAATAGASNSSVIGGTTNAAATGGTATAGTSNSSVVGGTTNAAATGGTAAAGTSNSSATGGTLAGGASTCGPRGGVGNTGSFGDELTPIPIGCKTNTDCLDGQICYDGPSAQNWACRQSCDTTTVGQQGSCAAGQICVFVSNGTSAACLDTCTPFLMPSTCQQDQWCYPAPHISFTGGVSVAGLCLASGNYAEGSRCPGGGCGVGLLCIAPGWNLDSYHCARACDPSATSGQTGACGVEATCIEQAAGRGACVVNCDPFSQTSQCPTGEWCYPFENLQSGSNGVQGRCATTGKHPEGVTCTVGDCAEGLKCSTEPEPHLGTPAMCRPICDPHAVGACAAGETCIPDRSSGIALNGGTCQKNCKFWQSDPCAAGCASNEWCAPSSLDQDFGRCESAAGQATTSCSYSKQCSAGNICVCANGSMGDSCTSDGHCEQACSLSTTASNSGNCPTGEICTPKPVIGGWSGFGTCRPTCDYDANVDCANATQTCVPGELLPHGIDTCLSVEVGTGACGFLTAPGTPCGSTALCLEELLGTDCTAVCRSSQGAFGTSNHPDCPKSSSICTEISPGLAYGTCG